MFRLTWMKQEQNLKILKQGGSLFEPNVSFLGLVFPNLTVVILRTRISSGGMGSQIIPWQTTSSCGDYQYQYQYQLLQLLQYQYQLLS